MALLDVQSDTWHQMVCYLIVGVGPHTYQCCMILTEDVQPPPPLYNKRGIWVKHSGLVEWGMGLLKVEGRVIKQDLIPYVVQSELANVPVEG